MTYRDPLLPDNSILTSAASNGLTGVWGKMDASALVAKPFMFDMSSLIPDYNKLMVPIALQISKSVAGFVTTAYPNQISGVQKMVLEAAGVNGISKIFLDSHDKMLRGMFPSMHVIAGLGLADQMQSSIGAITKSLAASVDTSHINSILANAATFKDRLAEEDCDELTGEFFDCHPDLTTKLEELPALYALSKADRRLIVWFVGVIVTLYVGNALMHIGTDFPEVKDIFDAFGLDLGGGAAAGGSAAALTNKVLDKLPQEDAL